jgi:outer membrane protein assembly factor BamE
MPRTVFVHTRVRLAAACSALLALAGCESLQTSENLLGVVTPYRVEIVQGNVVTKEQFALVKPGMSRLQVRNILGSPLLTDLFHANRWDYMFTIKRQGAEPQRRSVVAWFEGEMLKSIDAPELPSEREFVAAISTVKRAGTQPVLELSEEQRKALPLPPKAEPATTTQPPLGAARSYPPLETP